MSQIGLRSLFANCVLNETFLLNVMKSNKSQILLKHK